VKGATQPDSIVGRYEIAKICGVTRQGVATIVDHPDFPPPICTIGKQAAPLFYRRDVERFQAERERIAAAEAAAA
jgi:hypothetical protein